MGKFKPKSRFQFKPRTQKPGAQQPAAADPRSFNPSGTTTTTATTTNTNTNTSTEQQSPATSYRSTTTDDPTKDYNAILQADASPSSVVRRPSFSTAKSITIRSQAGLRIALPASAAASTSSQASITDLDRCVVDMTAPTAAQPLAGLALQNVRRSVVVAGRVGGAVHITGVSDAVVVVAARQVRIHECRNVDLYLRCASHPIIEDCEGMRFAPVVVGTDLVSRKESFH